MLLKKVSVIIALMFCGVMESSAQVTLPTGSAVFSLPIFNWSDDSSHLTSLVALSYNSGNGLKVDNVASNVGTGWNLVAGGVITRMQVGEPDDQKEYSGAYPLLPGFFPIKNKQDVTRYPAGWLYKQKDPKDGCPLALTKYPTYESQNQLYGQNNATAEDKQIDYFSFQFNGKSGMFVLDPVGGDHGVSLGDTKMQITFQRDETMTSQGIRTTISAFTITDVDGFVYKFNKRGLTKILKTSFSDATGTYPQTQPPIEDNKVFYQSAFDDGPTAAPWYNTKIANPFIVSSWYLTEVDDPFTSRKIIFNYGQPLVLKNDVGADISYNNSTKKFCVISYKKSITTSYELDNITFPDQHKVTLNYAPQERVDFTGEKAIASIDVTYYGRYLSKYVLNTTYFLQNRYGTPTSTFQKSVARLCLRSVQKIGVDLKDDSPPYIFDYYTGSAGDDVVPSPFAYAKDVWGFYNGDNSIKANSPLTGGILGIPRGLLYSEMDFQSAKGLCFQNVNVSGTFYNQKSKFAQNGLLKQIVYPTGGSLTYTYDQNMAAFSDDVSHTVRAVGGVHVSQTSSSDGGYSNGCANAITTKYDYVMNGVGSAPSLWGVETPVNKMTSNNFYKDEHRTLHYEPLFNFSCKWHFLYPGILSQNEAIGLSHWQQLMTALAPYLAVLSFISDVMDVVNICGPVTPLAVIAIVLDVITSIAALIFSCPQTITNTYSSIFYNFDINQSSPLPAQFRRVEITESPGTNGKTVQTFTHGDKTTPTGNDYYAIWFDQPNPTFSAKQRFAPWAYGLPYLTTIYDASGNKIEETEIVYDYSNAKSAFRHPILPNDCPPHATNWVTCAKCQVINNYAQRNDNWSNPALFDASSNYTTVNTSDMLVDLYNIFSGRVEVYKNFKRTYKPTDVTQFVQTETDYYYNIGDQCSTISNYDVRQINTFQSNGDINTKIIKYTTDFNTGVLATLVQKNIVSTPVSTISSVTKSGTTTYLGEKVTEFAVGSNNDIRPSRILEQRFAAPVSSITAYSGPTTTNYSNYKILQTFKFINSGHLVGLTDEGGRNIMNVYGNNYKNVVGVAINADASVDKIVYTSFEDGNYGGWAPTTGSFNFTSGITGSKSFNLTGSLSASMGGSKMYTLSFWATSAPTLNAGSTLTKSGPTYKGYTYYEYDVAAGTATVTITGTTTIDEVRLFPKAARLKTTTYDPLIGKTSECDENNRIINYSYDNLGRLQMIRDESGNIMKMYEYNNVSAAKQAGCPGNYGNRALSETFTRACSVGYQGSNVPISVAANVYTSAFSQFDADMQAETYLLTNGQTNANTNGSCSLIYYNTLQSDSKVSGSCAAGYKGTSVVYTVPPGRYSSIISQADADAKAIADVNANAWAYANSPDHMACVIDNTPDWEWNAGDETTPADPSYCLTVGGQLPPHLFIFVRDVNPNSPSYNQTQWVDSGPSASCPANTYYSAARTQVFTRNCSGGSQVPYTVAPGKYNSTVSQAAADQLATDEINANGQANADANGTCCLPVFNYSSGITSILNSMVVSGTLVSFTYVFNYPSGQSSFTLGTISPACVLPTGTRTVPFTIGSNTFNLIISTSGVVTIQLVSGSAPSGSIGFVGKYDIQSNLFYSAARSGSFTRNNCTAGQVGGSVLYTVVAYKYYSSVSQAAADQLAQDDVNANGQNYANSAGTCSVVCGFNWTASITNHPTTSVSSSGTTVNFNFTFVAPVNGYTGGTIGTITGGCIPTGTRNMTITDGSTSSRTWSVTISTSGSVSISKTSGTAPTNSYPPVVLIGSFVK